MSVFGVILNDCEPAERFFRETNERLKENHLVKNPYVGSIKKLGQVYVVKMQPVYFNYTWFIWLVLVASIIGFGFHYKWHIPMIAVGSLSIFWTKYFLFFMMKKGLKKAGYVGPVRMISPAEIIEKEVLQIGTGRCFAVPGREEKADR